MERDREEMKAFAMEQGAIEKKDDETLDWMYKGPNEMVNREDYLLGRPIDKQFEQMAQAERDIEQNKPIKNHVEHECIPPSLRFFSGNEQADLARKLQEDPLCAIKKKEMERRSQLLKDPVKLKQLQQLVALQMKRSKDDEKKKKKNKSTDDSDGSDVDKKLDDLLAAKYKKLKGKINVEDLIKSVKKHRKNRKRKKSRKKESSDSDDSESDSSSSDESTKQMSKEHKRHKTKNHNQKDYNKRKNNDDDKYYVEHKKRKQKYQDRASRNNTNYSDEEARSSRHKASNYGLMKADGTKFSPHRKNSSTMEDIKNQAKTAKKEEKWIPAKRQKLSEEEKEQRRQDMMANAAWRDKERERNVKKYNEQEEKESVKEMSFDKGFLQKYLAIVADKETVASRIKSNVNNIQRFKHSMDKNFAKR